MVGHIETDKTRITTGKLVFGQRETLQRVRGMLDSFGSSKLPGRTCGKNDYQPS